MLSTCPLEKLSAVVSSLLLAICRQPIVFILCKFSSSFFAVVCVQRLDNPKNFLK